MEKTRTIICLILIYFLIYFFQANIFNYLTISGVKPNMFIIFILFIGLFAGRKVGLILGLIFGVILDSLISKSIGSNMIMYGILGLLAELLDKRFSKDSRLIMMIMVFITTIIFEVGIYMYNIAVYNYMIQISFFIKIVLIEATYNVLITIIIYPLIKRFGEYLENLFRPKSMISNYF